MTYRVLVVDDFERWRRHIRARLTTARWQIVGEAADGIDAVEKARALQPDLILLDIGLPMLNGIQAAAQILAANPNARILFVTEHDSCDVAEAALATGARGYILKSESARELTPAMEAVVAGRRFLGARFGGRVFEKTVERSALPLDHDVLFYADETVLLDRWTRFIEGALQAGNSVVCLADDAHCRELEQRLQANGVDVAGAIREQRYLRFSVVETLAAYMVDGWPDEERFWRATISMMMSVVRASTRQRPRIYACGECAPRLLKQGKADAAIRLEQLWNDVIETYQVEVFCAYPTDLDDDHNLHQRICGQHSEVHV